MLWLQYIFYPYRKMPPSPFSPLHQAHSAGMSLTHFSHYLIRIQQLLMGNSYCVDNHEVLKGSLFLHPHSRLRFPVLAATKSDRMRSYVGRRDLLTFSSIGGRSVLLATAAHAPHQGR